MVRLRHLLKPALLALLCGFVPAVLFAGVPPDRLLLRQEYNAVSARIDSLVRSTKILDPKALDASRLPEGENRALIPPGMSVVLIFWADDEARVWINGYLVGQTRLTPVEVEIPQLYLRRTNRIRALCWDTDWVESGFLCGLYLKDGSGKLHPILVSDGTWKTDTGQAEEITYIHPMPDIPGAHVIWKPTVFGTVNLTHTFDNRDIQKAASRATPTSAPPPGVHETPMDYHNFVRSLAVLQQKREELKQEFPGEKFPDIPTYAGPPGRSVSLTLGKAAPLEESLSRPVAKQVQAWAEKLPEEEKKLIYPKPRKLKGEAAATPTSAQQVPVGGQSGPRERAYRPPSDRPTAPAGAQRGREGAETEGGIGKGTGSPGGEGGGRAGGGGGGGSRAYRLGLLLPTVILALYVAYALSNWEELTAVEGPQSKPNIKR